MRIVSTFFLVTVFTINAGFMGRCVCEENLQPAKAKGSAAVPLGSPDFYPSPDNATGWRGDGTGRYPGATPPKEWSIRLKNCPGLATSASKPKGDPAKLDAKADLALNDWIALGAWTTADMPKALETAYLDDELNAEPSEGDKADDKQWVRLPMQNGAVNLVEVFGETQRAAGERAADDPKQKKLIYAVTYAFAPSAGDAVLYLTHGNGYRLYLNGQLVTKKEGTDSFAIYGGEPVNLRLALKQGWNRLLLKSCGSQSTVIDHQWAFSAWMQLLPLKGVKLELENKNIAYMAALPGVSVSDPIVVGDKLFLTGNHWLAAVRKQDGQLLWYRTVIPHDGHAQETQGEATVIEEYNAACKKTHELDEQYVSAFKDGKIPSALADQYTQLADKMKGLLQKLDAKRANLIYKAGFLQSEPGWAMTPCSDGKNVYAWDEMAVALCCDLDGKQQWSSTVEHGGGQEHGYSASPVIVDGKFVCSQKNLLAFDLKTGALIWNSASYHSTWGSLIRAKAGEEALIVGPQNFCHSTKDGQPFRGDKGSNPKGGIMSTPIPVENSQAAGMSGGDGFDLVEFGAAIQHTNLAWPKFGLSGGLRGDTPIASPVYHEGFAYLLTMGGTLLTFDLKAKKFAGLEHLDTRTSYNGSSVGGRAGITASPAFANGLLYFFDDSGNTVVREPGLHGKVVARNEMVLGPLDQNGHLTSTNSSPVFDGSRIYWRAGNRLYCIGEK